MLTGASTFEWLGSSDFGTGKRSVQGALGKDKFIEVKAANEVGKIDTLIIRRSDVFYFHAEQFIGFDNFEVVVSNNGGAVGQYATLTIARKATISGDGSYAMNYDVPDDGNLVARDLTLDIRQNYLVALSY